MNFGDFFTIIFSLIKGRPFDLGKRKISQVWNSELQCPHIVGMLGTKWGLFVTTSNVGKSPYRSQIWLMNKNEQFTKVYQGSQETIGQPWEHDHIIWFPVEHGSNVLRWDGNAIVDAGPTKGRWSVAGCENVAAYNNSYSGEMNDIPVLADVYNGEIKYTLDKRGMPRSIFRHDKKLHATVNYGPPTLWSENKGSKDTEMLHAISAYGDIFGGGGVYTGPQGARDGRVFINNKSIGDTYCKSIEFVALLNGHIIMVGVNPPTLLEVKLNNKIGIINRPYEEPPRPGGEAFGGAAGFYIDNYYWGHGHINNLSRIYRVK